MQKKPKIWVTGYLVLVFISLFIVALSVIKIDPYFHFHKPNTDYYYTLDNQRCQNDGMARNFDYEGVITGSSMTENFRTSEATDIFGCEFIKLPYSGGTFNEINDNLEVALSHNSEIRIVIRGLDMSRFFDDKDATRHDMGTYPTYLYDDNFFNDVEYVFNRDVVFSRVYPMIKESNEPNFEGGITSFDDYSNWMHNSTFGVNSVLPNGVPVIQTMEQEALTEEEREMIIANVQQNVTAIAEEYPDVTFYYFITPYSVAWWQRLINSGTLNKQIEAERLMIEEILKHENIKLYSFNCLTKVTTDLNNYMDVAHYGEWINSLMLNYMYNEEYLITHENYEHYLEEEFIIYSTYDYNQLNTQEDYEDDNYVKTVLEIESVQ